MRSYLKTLACVLLPFVCIGLEFAQARSGEPASPVLTPQFAAHLPAPVPCDATKGSCWKPTIGMEWQWQLSCDTAKTCTNLNVQVPFYVIDAVGNPASTVAAIHKRGEHAYCYVDIGSWEDKRSDASKFPESVLGKRYVGWPHERWLDIRQLGILAPIMIARMKVCVQKASTASSLITCRTGIIPPAFPSPRRNPRITRRGWQTRRIRWGFPPHGKTRQPMSRCWSLIWRL